MIIEDMQDHYIAKLEAMDLQKLEGHIQRERAYSVLREAIAAAYRRGGDDVISNYNNIVR